MSAARTHRSRLVPAATVVGGVAAAVLLSQGLGAGPAGPPSVAVPAAVQDVAAPAPDARAPGALADLFPTPGEMGYGWVVDPAAASQQITDGQGLVHPCQAEYPSDGASVERAQHDVAQSEMDVPRGMAMTFELVRYPGDGAQQALAERVEALQACREYTVDFVGYPGTPVDVRLLAPPEGGDGAAAHLAVTPDTAVGRQVVEYTYLVARQGDVLLSAVVGNGNGSGDDLDAFARGYFQQARLRLAGLPAPSPETAADPAQEAA